MPTNDLPPNSLPQPPLEGNSLSFHQNAPYTDELKIPSGISDRIPEIQDGVTSQLSTPIVNDGFENRDPSDAHDIGKEAAEVDNMPWIDISPHYYDNISVDFDLDFSPDSPSFSPSQDFHDMSESKMSRVYSVNEVIGEQEDAGSGLNVTMSPISPMASDSWDMPLFNQLFIVSNQPQLAATSEELLMLRFDKQTCSILSIKDGPTENPWRTLLWPLAQENGALRHAITAMTAFHATKENPDLRYKGLEHLNQSLQLLSQGIKNMPLAVSLATTLVLTFCESWDMLISTGMRHLRGASHLVAQIMANHQQSIAFPNNDPCLGFLCRTWVYMTVIARLTSLEGDDSTDFDIVQTPICDSIFINRSMDPLMGCASTLFPTIGRVANLVRQVRQRTQDNSLKIISQAEDLKSKLESWEPPAIFGAPEDISNEVEQGLRTAEAYRGASMLYLLQAVPEISYGSVTEKITALAKEVLTHIATVPVTSGTVIIQIFPLLAAGCEAVDSESRAFVEDRWQAMMRRMQIQNLDRCLDVAKEVWERRDNAQLELQRRKTRAARSNSQPAITPKTIAKCKYSTIDDNCLDSPDSGQGKRTQSPIAMISPTLKSGFLRRESTTSYGGLDFELTVRGRQHWAGVMKDLRWEGK